MKDFLNDVQVEEDVYQKALKDHEEWVKEEEKKVDALRAQEKKLDGRKSIPRKNPQKIK